MIQRLESVGFHQQFSGDKNRIIRTRCVYADQEFVDSLWPRMRPSIPELSELYDESFPPEPIPISPLESFRPTGLNELLRCYKYQPGEQFRRHEDFAHEWDSTKRTFLTVLFYLNEDFTGGETRFEEGVVEPKIGTAAIFPHELVHEGCPVATGVKYSLRSDVVFTVDCEAG